MKIFIGQAVTGEDILKKLKSNYKLGLISKSQYIEKREQEIKSSGLYDYFDFVNIVENKGKSEFLECIDKLNSVPEKTVVVDDRMSRGIKTGNELGCKTFWIQIGDRSFDMPTKETGEPLYKINSIKELLKCLK